MYLLILMFAHLLADYPLQGEFLANMKGKNLIVLISHAGIWTGCIAIAGYLIGFDISYLDIALLFVVHAVADYLKATNKLWYKNLDSLKGGLLIDQLIHLGQLFLFIGMNV
ncbi:DUF3307 domain-containing protein [Bacillus sp. MRMR6]|uniref:DUF3307 domain-containing protein n=1 Tax=Bacillus sp. MRMR6 TaxID=1928617 RepID=UPI000953467B|nr:DUF3307 domain-containing protein [Bacillus sp. MRMR6]OLS39138.1 hypothetical protein BTR25_13480 [Bacillus sp. MRMR6]